MQTELFNHTTIAEQKFNQYHSDNPQVYIELVTLAREAKAAGRRKIGIKMLYELVRWNRNIVAGDKHFKLPNNHHSRYARMIMEHEPELKGIFETRELRS